MEYDMNIETIRLPDYKKARNAIIHREVAPYLRGPIPWSWLHAAAKLPGSALSVGLVLWFHRSLNKSVSFKIGTGDISRFLGVSTATVRRAINTLQIAGLIERECLEGRKCQITIIETPLVLDVGAAISGGDPIEFAPVETAYLFNLNPMTGSDTNQEITVNNNVTG